MLSGAPSAALQASTKSYSDSYLGGQAIDTSALSSITNNQVLGWSASTSKWAPLTVVGAADATAIQGTNVDSGAPTTAKVLVYDTAVASKWAAATLGAASLASDSVTTVKILDSNVTTAKLASSSVTAAVIDSGAVTATKIGALAIDNSHVSATAAVAVSKLAAGTAGQVLMTSAAGATAWTTMAAYLRGNLLQGFAISNNAGDATNDVDIAAGTATDSTYASFLSGSAMTKRLDATWAAGNNAGGMFSGAAPANTTYHVFAILKDADQTVDYGFDTTVTAASIPGGYTKYRRIGSIVRSAGSIQAFYQKGDLFYWTDIKVSLDSASIDNTTGSLQTLDVPTGVQVKAMGVINPGLINSTTAVNTISMNTPTSNSQDPSGGAVHNGAFRGIVGSMYSGHYYSTTSYFEILTNTSAQILMRRSGGAYNTAPEQTTVQIWGWIDRRGRDD